MRRLGLFARRDLELDVYRMRLTGAVLIILGVMIGTALGLGIVTLVVAKNLDVPSIHS